MDRCHRSTLGHCSWRNVSDASKLKEVIKSVMIRSRGWKACANFFNEAQGETVMKKSFKWLLILTALVPIYSISKAEKHESVEISSKTGQSVSFTKVIDLSPWNGFSAQAVYGDGTSSTGSIASGSRASATITIGNNPSALVSSQAFITINLKSTATISGKTITLNGIVYTEGTDFTGAGVSTATAAANLNARLNGYPNYWVSTVVGTTVTVRFATYGISGNGLTAVTSSAANFGLSAATFSGGVNRYSIFINGTELKDGVNFVGSSSSATLSHNIVVAINANTTLNTQVVASSSSATPGIVTVKALLPGYSNYSISSSTTGYLTSGGFPGGLASDVDLTNDLINKTSHGLNTGERLLLVTTVGTIPGGLTTGTTYFAIKLNENQYALGTTSTTAVAGTKIDLTSVTDNSTTDVRPLALSVAANNGFFWDVSNDGTNFTPLSTVTYSSVTYSAAGNSVWDFGTMQYKYLRANFTGPTSGAISLGLKLFGRRD